MKTRPDVFVTADGRLLRFEAPDPASASAALWGGDELYAFVTERGIVGYNNLPLVAARRDVIEQARPYAQQVAQISGETVKLVRFHAREDLETLKP